MNLLDLHAKKQKVVVKKYSRSVIFTDTNGVSYPAILVIWNDVQHGLKMEGFETEPMSQKSSIYIDTDTLNEAGFMPDDGWKITGSPNNYTAEADYFIEIPKDDNQLPGHLFFLAQDKGADAGWTKV